MATGRPRAKDSDDPDDPWRHISSFLADGNLARELNAERVARQAPDADEEEM